MQAYLSAIRGGQTALLRSTKGSDIRNILGRIKQELPDYRGLQGSEAPDVDLEALTQDDNDHDELYSPLFAALGDVALYGSLEAFAAYSDLMKTIADGDTTSIGRALGSFTGICRLEVGLPATKMR
jgi:hypothetical protein